MTKGFFRREGIEIELGPTATRPAVKATESLVPSPKGVNPFGSHGRLLEQGKADMYNACEWGNYCRLQDTVTGSRQVGRRGIVTYAAIVVRPESPVYNRPAARLPHRGRALLWPARIMSRSICSAASCRAT